MTVWLCGFLLVKNPINIRMTDSTKQTTRTRRVLKPYAKQKFQTSQEPEHKNSRYRVSVRRAETDWDHFEQEMQILIDACNDLEYRDHLLRIARRG